MGDYPYFLQLIMLGIITRIYYIVILRLDRVQKSSQLAMKKAVVTAAFAAALTLLLAPTMLTSVFAVPSLDVNIDPIGFVNKQEETVLVGGTVTCSSSATGELQGRIVQNSGKGDPAIDFSTDIECVAGTLTVWGFILGDPQAAQFHSGRADVSVEWSPCDQFGNCGSVQDSKTVKLRSFAPFN
jgi:hypothetical protein